MVPKDSNRWPWLCLVGRPRLTPSLEDNFSFPFARSLLTIKVEDFQLKNTRSALIFSLSSKTLFSSAPWHPSDKCWFRTDLHSFFSKELKNHVWLRIVEIQLDELEPTQTNNRSSLSLLLAHCLALKVPGGIFCMVLLREDLHNHPHQWCLLSLLTSDRNPSPLLSKLLLRVLNIKINLICVYWCIIWLPTGR